MHADLQQQIQGAAFYLVEVCGVQRRPRPCVHRSGLGLYKRHWHRWGYRRESHPRQGCRPPRSLPTPRLRGCARAGRSAPRTGCSCQWAQAPAGHWYVSQCVTQFVMSTDDMTTSGSINLAQIMRSLCIRLQNTFNRIVRSYEICMRSSKCNEKKCDASLNS